MKESIYGAIIIGFVAQLLISLIRYEFKELKHTSTKFLKKEPNEFDSYSRFSGIVN